MMKWTSAVSDEADLREAVRDAGRRLVERLGRRDLDLLIVFVSAAHRRRYDELPELLAIEVDARVVVGCSAAGVVGDGIELEQGPGLSLTGAVLEGATLRPAHVWSPLPPSDLPAKWEALTEAPIGERPAFLVLSDPYTFDVQPLLEGLDRTYPGATIFGGLASGASFPGTTVLLCNGEVYRQGAVVLALSGISVSTIVAQGCRPIDRPRFITACDGNRMFELDGKPAVPLLREIHEHLDARDQDLFRQSLAVGVAMRDQAEEYQIGDFVIRNIVSIEPKKNVVEVGTRLKELMVVQFHLRDPRTAAEELDALLMGEIGRHSARPLGALLLSCVGRGADFYGRPNHDSDRFCQRFGDTPLAGFFCSGEVGPVRGNTFLHGYTSCFALFRPIAEPDEG